MDTTEHEDKERLMQAIKSAQRELEFYELRHGESYLIRRAAAALHDARVNSDALGTP